MTNLSHLKYNFKSWTSSGGGYSGFHSPLLDLFKIPNLHISVGFSYISVKKYTIKSKSTWLSQSSHILIKISRFLFLFKRLTLSISSRQHRLIYGYFYGSLAWLADGEVIIPDSLGFLTNQMISSTIFRQGALSFRTLLSSSEFYIAIMADRREWRWSCCICHKIHFYYHGVLSFSGDAFDTCFLFL